MAFVNDTFTDVDGTLLQNHTADDGGTWTVHPASDAGVDFIVASGRIYPEDGMALYYHSAVPPSAEYDVEAVFKTLSQPEAGPGICARLDTTANTKYMVIYTEARFEWRLFKTINGSHTLLGVFAEVPADQAERTVRFEVRDATKKVFIGGVERISSSDNEITAAGRVGVRNGGAGNTSTVGTHIDSLSAMIESTGVAVRLSRSMRNRRRMRA